MKFQLRLPIAGGQTSPDFIEETARDAESLGYDAVQVADRMMWTVDHNRTYFIGQGSMEAVEENPEPNVYEPLATLSFVAGVTKKVRLVTSALVLPFRNPVVLAKEAATLDVLSHGRLILGVGVAGGVFGQAVANVMNVPFAARGRMADEYIRAMREIWSKPSASFHGKYVKFNDAVIFPKPTQKPGPPIWIAGSTERAMRRVAELGDGWHPTYASASEIRNGVTRLNEEMKKRDAASRKIDIGPTLFISLAKTTEEAEAISKRTLAILSRGVVFPDYFKALEEAKRRNLIGSADDVHRGIEEYQKAGADYIGLKFIYRTNGEFRKMVESFASEIMPSF